MIKGRPGGILATIGPGGKLFFSEFCAFRFRPANSWGSALFAQNHNLLVISVYFVSITGNREAITVTWAGITVTRFKITVTRLAITVTGEAITSFRSGITSSRLMITSTA